MLSSRCKAVVSSRSVLITASEPACSLGCGAVRCSDGVAGVAAEGMAPGSKPLPRGIAVSKKRCRSSQGRHCCLTSSLCKQTRLMRLLAAVAVSLLQQITGRQQHVAWRHWTGCGKLRLTGPRALGAAPAISDAMPRTRRLIILCAQLLLHLVQHEKLLRTSHCGATRLADQTAVCHVCTNKITGHVTGTSVLL